MPLFDFLRKFFTWADTSSRKRGADSDCGSYLSPTKRPRCSHDKMLNGREIIEIEDDEDDVQICDEVQHRMRQMPGHTGTTKRCISSYLNNTNQNHLPIHQASTMPSLRGKSLLNSRPVRGFGRRSTISRSIQLKEKEEYGHMLQNFLPQRVQILQPKPAKTPQKPIEVIDVETYKLKPTPKTPEVFYTPKLTPTRWFTPMTRPVRKPITRLEKSSIEEIKIDDESPPESRVTTPKEHSNASRIELVARTAEAVPTNSLRDKLSAKAVMKEDFIPRVAENYNGRIQQRNEEVAELEARTRLLAKHNRLQREVALVKQLSKSLKICEAILDEADYEEEAELPELTDSMMDMVKKALNPRPADQVLVESFGLSITRKDIYTLAGLNWLNDEVINFYMNLLIARGGTDKYPKVYAMNTFFYPKLLSGGHSSLKRWTRKVDIFAQDIVVVPIHLGMHWCMSVIDFRDQSIRYYDSMGGENPKCLMALRKYLEDESLDKKKKPYDTRNWSLESMMDIPQQMNGSDCGVFSCTFAEFICANRKLNFQQEDMPYFRSKMVYEILNVKLL